MSFVLFIKKLRPEHPIQINQLTIDIQAYLNLSNTNIQYKIIEALLASLFRVPYTYIRFFFCKITCPFDADQHINLRQQATDLSIYAYWDSESWWRKCGISLPAKSKIYLSYMKTNTNSVGMEGIRATISTSNLLPSSWVPSAGCSETYAGRKIIFHSGEGDAAAAGGFV
jgi:hypothetical protein